MHAILPFGVLAGLRRRSLGRGTSARRAFRGGELGELALGDLTQLADECTTRLLEPDNVGLELTSVVANRVELALSFRARLAQDQLRLALGLLANFGAQLLRRDRALR